MQVLHSRFAFFVLLYKKPRFYAGFLQFRVGYLTAGCISNWWNGGGEETVHSNVMLCG